MGMGANAGFLSALGWRVVGVDLSDVAVFAAHRQFPALLPVIADLGCFSFPPAAFDMILNFYFLNRRWLRDFERITRPGGVVMVETLTVDMLDQDKSIAPQHLLEREELPTYFTNWEILYQAEGWVRSDHGKTKAVSSLIARKSAR
jgi:SAM-dependent methyltransferase